MAWIKFLKGWSLILLFTGVPLLDCFDLCLWECCFLLGLAWWEVSSLMPKQINLSHFGVTCNCFDMSTSWLWRLHFLGKLLHLPCWILLKINIRIILWSWRQIPHLSEKNPEYISVQDTCSFWWVLGKRHLSLNCIVPLIDRSVSLSEACQQVKSGLSLNLSVACKNVNIWTKYNF